ncbi:chemosensory receptor A [Elysia marginata]|uniref:Chemosensory receptor A n=1 Tax=Elysia marginata TaxID=1093978 RepID=A0AAV4FNP3_9GAST|nr:chemosensory receptor A [Elysia marginata]
MMTMMVAMTMTMTQQPQWLSSTKEDTIAMTLVATTMMVVATPMNEGDKDTDDGGCSKPMKMWRFRYRNLFVVLWSFTTLLETLNASTNIIVYYNMSTVYRKIFLQIMRRCHCKSQARVMPATGPAPAQATHGFHNNMVVRGPLVGS